MVVIQEEATGCGIAAVANVVGKSYAEMKAIANDLGITASDESLWSDTQYVRRLLAHFGVLTSVGVIPFASWQALPDLALLAIKHHEREGRFYWHWVVFQRIEGEPWVLDSASYLPENKRQDFQMMQPAWYITVHS